MHIAERATHLKPSATLAVTELAHKLQSQGKDIISLSAGEPDFDTPSSIKDAAKKALDQGFTKYTAVSGISELRQAVIEEVKKTKKVAYSKNEVMITAGAKQAIFNFFQCFLNPLDEVIIPAPYWVSYPEMVTLTGAKPITLETTEKNNFKAKKKDLESLITKKTKVFVLVSPSNPTCTLYSQDELNEILPVLEKHKIFILCDDIYESLIYDEKLAPHPLLINPRLKNNILHVNGVSKTYAMTGWRLGWACGPENLIQAMVAYQSQSTSNPNSIAQKAALYALTHPIPEVLEMKKQFKKRRDFVCNRLSHMKGISFVKPDGAFFVFINISTYNKLSVEFSKMLLEKAGLAVVPGSAFGKEGYIRMSFANSLEELDRAMNRFEKALIT